MNLFLLQYNNYYNRILKRHNTLEEYLQYSPYDFPIIGVTNFNFGDGISVQQIVNYPYEGNMPDYAVAVDGNNNIVGRYFIIDMVYLRKGQYTATLYRDLLADYKQELLNAPIFVEKGTLPNESSFIFNQENMAVNQIKKEEQLLKDRFGEPWLVGYLPAKRENDIVFTYGQTVNYEESFPSLNDYLEYVEMAPGSTVSYVTKHTYLSKGNIYPYTTVANKFRIAYNELGKQFANIGGTEYGYIEEIGDSLSPLQIYRPSADDYTLIIDAYKDLLQEGYSSAGAAYEAGKVMIDNYLGNGGKDKYNAIRKETGRVFYSVAENKMYEVKVTLNTNVTEISFGEGTIPFVRLSNVTNTIINGDYTTLSLPAGETYNSRTFGAIITQEHALFEVIPIDASGVVDRQVSIPTTTNRLNDAPYAMFAIPYGNNITFRRGAGEPITSSSKSNAFELVTSLSAAQTGVGGLYDLQLLPYCPFQSLILGERELDISNLKEGTDYTFIAEQEGNPHKGLVMFWCTSSTFSFNINNDSFNLDNPFQGSPMSNKLWNELYMYRLCSPNYSGVFEFSAAKMNGVQWINVDCTYKPFSPYIHLNPNFENLYGSDFNDARGLICGGDFSITQLNNAWETYQRNNVNYEKSFQRTIENMEVNNKYQRIGDISNAITGTVSGAASGAMAGGLLTGNPIGAVVGGVAGGAASLAGGIIDVSINDKLRAEALDYTKDMYGYNLENIKALPTTLAKVSAFTANNKIYPYIEVYTCTDEEKNAFINKLKYNGMTVMRVGTLNEFINYKIHDKDYFKGKLIRLELGDKAEDFHIVNQISAELNKGVFI